MFVGIPSGEINRGIHYRSKDSVQSLVVHAAEIYRTLSITQLTTKHDDDDDDDGCSHLCPFLSYLELFEEHLFNIFYD